MHSIVNTNIKSLHGYSRGKDIFMYLFVVYVFIASDIWTICQHCATDDISLKTSIYRWVGVYIQKPCICPIVSIINHSLTDCIKANGLTSICIFLISSCLYVFTISIILLEVNMNRALGISGTLLHVVCLNPCYHAGGMCFHRKELDSHVECLNNFNC